MKEGWAIGKHAWGCIVGIKVPQDGRIRIVHQAGYYFRDETKSGGILLDISTVDWSAPESVQNP
jgi:hypothetical protein